MIEVSDFSWVTYLGERRTIIVISFFAIALGLWHLAISIRCIFGRAPSITVSHHLLHLFAPFVLLILGSCGGPAIDSGVMIAPGDIEGALLFLFRYPTFFGFIGLCIFPPNLLLAFIAIYRRSPNDNTRNA